MVENSREALLELAERVEKAEGETRELFVAAFDAIYGPAPDSDYQPRREPSFSPVWSKWTKAKCRFLNLLQVEAWNDAAMSLVPEGCDGWRVEDHPMAGPCALVGEQEGYAATPALALVSAALRARSAATA